MPRAITRLLLPVALTALLAAPALACTNLIVSPGASADGSVYVTYTCDGEFHPTLQRIPAGDHEPGEMQEITHWNGKVLGKIPYPPHTFGVVNLMNDHQVSIAETTTVGRSELVNPDGMLHYWHLMRLSLQRASTARECVEVMGRLVDEFGYRSSGESYCIADPQETWIVEMVGPGEGGHGAYWVALRVPDGFISAFANGGRIGTFPLKDSDKCLYTKEMIDFATKKGWHDPASGPFNWREAFHPQTPQQLRYTATRVWSIFRRAAPSFVLSPNYHRGVADAEPYPLWIKPDHKLTTADVFALMRDHYEGTAYDMTQGVDAGPGSDPRHLRPMGFEVDGVKYTWERPISTQQTGFSMVCQMRSWLPDMVGGVSWYGLDDTDFTCYTPLYCDIDALPVSYATGSLGQFSWDSAWWVFNFVSNFSGLRYDKMIGDVRTVRNEIENHYLDLQPAVENAAAELLKTDPELARSYLTDYSVMHAEDVVVKWRKLGEYLLTKYNDGYIKDEKGSPHEVGYPEAWLKKVLEQRPDQFRLPQDDTELAKPTEY